MPVLGLTHIGICVSDPERSRRIYEDVLGFTPVSKLAIDGEPTATMMGMREGELKLRCLFLERDGVRLELMHFEGVPLQGDGRPTPPQQRGLTHLALRVDDVESLIHELGALGCVFEHDRRIRNPEYGADVIWAIDPDGVRLELVQSPAPVFDPIGERL